MTITAQIVADSISPAGKRLTTMQLRYPRFIHSELMTHRLFSRNASSSRAIPVERMIKDLRRDPAMPVFWGSNKPGMQAGAELNEAEIAACSAHWLNAMNTAITYAEGLVAVGLHKQIANRILEPWAHINVVVTATEWDNFFALRCHPDAQPEIQQLAVLMREEMSKSVPIELQPGEWHLPYVNANDFSSARHHQKQGRITRDEPMYDELVEKVLIPVSVARCARVSYLTHDGRQTTVEEDMDLYEKLVGGVPLHASPAEHQGTPDDCHRNADGTPWNNNPKAWQHPKQHGNFIGWIQFRKLLEEKFDD